MDLHLRRLGPPGFPVQPATRSENTTSLAYDQYGELTSRSDELGRTTHYGLRHQTATL